MSDYEICTNMYRTEVFDQVDAASSNIKKGSMHGKVKIYTKAEIEKFIADRLDGLV